MRETARAKASRSLSESHAYEWSVFVRVALELDVAYATQHIVAVSECARVHEKATML